MSAEERVEELNRAFGSKTGDRPTFRAEHEGDDYLFGRRPRTARAVDVVDALAKLDAVGGDLEKLDPQSIAVLADAAAELEQRQAIAREERR